MAVAMAAEIERDLISQRTKEALAAKKRAGRNLGRPKGRGKSKLDKHRPEIEALLETGSTQRYIASRYNTTESNLSRWTKKHGLKRKKRANNHLNFRTLCTCPMTEIVPTLQLLNGCSFPETIVDTLQRVIGNNERYQ